MNPIAKLKEAITGQFKRLLFRTEPIPSDLLHHPFAVENIFCRPFEILPRRYNIHMLRYKFAVSKASWTNINLTFEETERMNAMKTRLVGYLTVEIEERALVYLALVADRMAVCMMYLTYIQYWACKHRCSRITFEMLSDKIFEDGFPTQSDLQTIWYAQKTKRQKGGSDNLIDYKAAQESIQLWVRSK